MNKRDFLKFLPVSAVAVAIPAAANTLAQPKKISCIVQPEPPTFSIASDGYYCVGARAPHSVLAIQANRETLSTAFFEQRSDGLYNLVFKHESNS